MLNLINSPSQLGGTNLDDGRRQTCHRFLLLICAVRGRSEPHYDVSNILFQTRHLFMDLEKRFLRAYASRHATDSPSASILHTFLSAWRRELGLPFTTESTLRNAVGCNCI